MIDLSIIIVNWNTKELITACIESILATTKEVDYEIIIVDNGSTDGSVEAVAKIKSKLAVSKKTGLSITSKACNLTIIKNTENLGFAKANNEGMRKAKGEYILLLNSDTKVKRGAIDRLYKFAKSKEDAGVVSARLLNHDGSVQPSCFRFPTLVNAISEFWLGRKGLFSKYAPYGTEPEKVDIVVGAAFLITPKARKEVGLLNENYFFFYEDFDYCRRVYAKSLKVYYLPEAEIYHYLGSSVRKIAGKDDAWKKLVPGSKEYHGLLKHSLITFVLWTAQKWQKLLRI